MLKFNEFLKEAADPVIEVDDARRLLNNKDDINTNLDALTAKPYQNAPIFLTQLRGVLERYGINLPQSVTPNFLNLSAELVFALSSASSSMPAGEDAPTLTDQSLYVVFDTNDDGYVDGYAQIVDKGELQDLLGMDPTEYLDHNPMPKQWIPPARRDDDAGNSDEY
jgi:hypothetical protein